MYNNKTIYAKWSQNPITTPPTALSISASLSVARLTYNTVTATTNLEATSVTFSFPEGNNSGALISTSGSVKTWRTTYFMVDVEKDKFNNIK
ncbi:hypothetical protein [Acetobacterium bakii]|uniref:hypothetical protein n=1 Tax=Acetobacterium bakii TaxID=52689 RepID=UPI000F8C696D|nr:hypothetical protein [Acetobacterium bakii]